MDDSNSTTTNATGATANTNTNDTTTNNTSDTATATTTSANTNDENNGDNVDDSIRLETIWLMKCPAMVSLFFQQSSSSDDSSSSVGPVAKVTVSIDPRLSNDDLSSTEARSTIFVTRELACTESRNTPKCFSMGMSRDFVPMFVFSESSQGCNNIEEYGKLTKERTNESEAGIKRIQVIDDTGKYREPMLMMTCSKASEPSVLMDNKKMKVKGSEMRRKRMDPEEMKKIMLKLFDRLPNWTQNQLVRETNQPKGFVKEMLDELCIYNNKGVKGTYEMKPEYQRSGEKPDSS